MIMAATAIGLKTHIWNNNLRSVILLAAYPFILMAIVWAIAAASGGLGMQGTDPAAYANRVVYHYWPAIATVVAIWFTIAWFFNTAMVRMVSHARPVTRAEEPALYNMLENLCIARGLTMPRMEVIESPALNAFASGVTDGTYSITVTRGLIETLQPDEMEAVLGHELTHIINRDVRLMMVCIVFTGMVGFAAQMMWSGMRHALWVPRSGGRKDGGSLIILYFATLAILMVGYLASMLARFALSRSREYMADAGSVELTKNPEAMMRALLRISGHDRIPQATDDIALMCIENSKPFLGLFTTHPPIAARLEAISRITGTPVPALQPPGRAGANDRNPWA
jgi:heat shock protein HtpX